MTDEGRRVFGDLEEIQAQWVNQIAAVIPTEDLEVTKRVMDAITERLDWSPEGF